MWAYRLFRAGNPAKYPLLIAVRLLPFRPLNNSRACNKILMIGVLPSCTLSVLLFNAVGSCAAKGTHSICSEAMPENADGVIELSG